MTDVAEGAKDLLVTAGAGTFGTDLFISREPATPDACITVFRSGGLEPNPKFLIDYPSLNIRVRGAKLGYQAAEVTCQLVKDTLLGISSQTINDDRWICVNMSGDPFFLGYDDNERPSFSLNFRLIIEAEDLSTERLPV